METIEKNWQEISLNFFREIVKEYFSEKHENFPDSIIELYDPQGVHRYFLDNLTINNYSDKYSYIRKVCPQIPRELLDMGANDLGGTLTISRKAMSLAKTLIKKLEENSNLHDFMDCHSLLDEMKSKIQESSQIYPMLRKMLDEFLINSLIKSVPPGETNASGSRMDPIWYKTNSEGKEVYGDDLVKADWLLSDEDKKVKIRVWSKIEYDSFKEEL